MKLAYRDEQTFHDSSLGTFYLCICGQSTLLTHVQTQRKPCRLIFHDLLHAQMYGTTIKIGNLSAFENHVVKLPISDKKQYNMTELSSTKNDFLSTRLTLELSETAFPLEMNYFLGVVSFRLYTKDHFASFCLLDM